MAHDLRSLPARNYGLGRFRPAAPVICTAKPTGTVNVGDSANTALALATEDLDTDSIHSNSSANTRMTVPSGLRGIWRISGTISYTAGVNGFREALIRKNGSTFLAKTNVPCVTNGRETVVNVTCTVYLDDADYVELVGWQDSGATLAATTSFTKLTVERLGDRIGPGGNVLFSADHAYKALTRYTSTINPQKVLVDDDPVLGPVRQVLRITTTNADNQVLYPRVQLQSPSSLADGDDVYVGFAVLLPSATWPSCTGDRSPVIHEIYGPPTNGLGPNVFRIIEDKFAVVPGVTHPTPTWSLAVFKDAWLDVVMRIKLSTDAGVGLHQLWINSGAGLTQQTFTNASQTYNLATLAAGVNDSGNNFSSLKLAYTDTSFGSLTILYAGHKIATTLADADPHSYG